VPSSECIWGCDSGQPFDREHIIAKQVADAMGMPYPVPMAWGDYDVSGGERLKHGEVEEKELAIVLENRVCKRCNRKWMKALDDRMLIFMRDTLATEASVELSKI
jgi:hypothetical protein